MKNWAFVSLILPIRNEAASIERCLRAVLNQDYPGEMEILIVDGMSTDDTREIVQSLLTSVPSLPFPVRILDNPGKIVPTGLNLALRRARGDIIIRVDGHCIIAPDYVQQCVAHIQQDGVDGVGGPMETIGETPMAKVVALAMSSPFGVGNSAFRTLSDRTMLVDTVPFPAYTRTIMQRVGLYDEELIRNQDDEYNYRIRKLGGKILLAQDVRSAYFSRASLKRLWRQYFQYGFYKVRVLQKHPRQMCLRQFVPPVFVLSLILSALLAISPALQPLSAIVPLTYLLVNLAASLCAIFHSRPSACSPRPAPRSYLSPLLLLLPLAFAILHIGYGLGFLLGLLKFWNRWGDQTGQVPAWTHEPA